MERCLLGVLSKGFYIYACILPLEYRSVKGPFKIVLGKGCDRNIVRLLKMTLIKFGFNTTPSAFEIFIELTVMLIIHSHFSPSHTNVDGRECTNIPSNQHTYNQYNL